MTCRCGKPTRDTLTVCEDCLTELNQALGDIPALEEELNVTISQQKGVDYRRVGGSKGGTKPAETPSPVNMGASDAKADLKALLVSWARLCHEEQVRNQSGETGLPDDNLPAISRWLMWRVDGLGLHEAGSDAVDEITAAVGRCQRMVDIPTERQYLGDCDDCDTGRLYARPASTWARCEGCDKAVPAQDVRDRLLARLDDRLCTAAEIARLSTYLGLRANRESVRKRINQWHARGLVSAHPAISDEVAFRFGEIYGKLIADDYSRTSSA